LLIQKPEASSSWLVPLPPADHIPPVKEVKGGLLYNSFRFLRELGLEKDYEAIAGSELTRTVSATLSSEWVDVDIARRHYETIHALQLPAEQIRALADNSVRILNGVFLQTLGRAARAAGFDARTALKLVVRIFPRVYRGGAIGVELTDTNQGVITFVGVSLMRVGYYRFANSVYVKSAIRLMSGDVRVTEGTHDEAKLTYRYLVRWSGSRADSSS
jgi:hypothetical protein